MNIINYPETELMPCLEVNLQVRRMQQQQQIRSLNSISDLTVQTSFCERVGKFTGRMYGILMLFLPTNILTHKNLGNQKGV
jgi:hypothetical protein